MSEPVDPYDRLRDLNPISPEDVANAASSAEATRALAEIIAGTRKPAHQWWPRRPSVPQLRRRTYLLALVPVLGVLAAAAWALTQGAGTRLTIGCYASTDLRAHTVVVPAGGGTAVDNCREIWDRGDFGSHPAPVLEACVLPSGAIGVFPSPNQNACAQLRLAPLTSTTRPAPTRASLVKLKNALVQTFLASGCIHQKRALAIVQAELRILGLTDWRVQINGTFTSRRPCASLAFDEEAHHVLLVPMPKQP